LGIRILEAHRSKALVDDEVLERTHGPARGQGRLQGVREGGVREQLRWRCVRACNEAGGWASQRALLLSASEATVSCFSFSSCGGDSGGSAGEAAGRRACEQSDRLRVCTDRAPRAHLGSPPKCRTQTRAAAPAQRRAPCPPAASVRTRQDAMPALSCSSSAKQSKPPHLLDVGRVQELSEGEHGRC